MPLHVLFPHCREQFYPIITRRRECRSCCLSFSSCHPLEEPWHWISSCKIRTTGDRLDWWEEEVKDKSWRALRAELKGYQKNKANGQGRAAPGQLGASADREIYLNDYLAGGLCCFKCLRREAEQYFSTTYK